MRLVEYKGQHRLRDDAHSSDYSVLLQKLMEDISSACTDVLAYRYDDPRESDVTLQINGETYVLPLSFLASMLAMDFLKGLIDDIHRGPEDRVYSWPLDETRAHPSCSGCGECEKRNLPFYPGTACMRKTVEVDPDERLRCSCEEYMKKMNSQ